MKWKLAKAKTTKINGAATGLRHDLEHYCRDLNGWPRSWMGLEQDLVPGEQLLVLCRPFLEHLAASDLSQETIQKHVDNVCALGGEFIRDLHFDPSLRKKSVDLALRRMIEYGGPLLYHGVHVPEAQAVPLRNGSLTLAHHPQLSPTRPKLRPHLKTISQLRLDAIVHFRQDLVVLQAQGCELLRGGLETARYRRRSK
jgi:hypothetical protein